MKDADGDGIIDAEDNCPNEAGKASNQGCPFADGDGDGIEDAKDKCPSEAGTAANNGCPELDAEETAILQEALEGVTFKSNSDIMVGDSQSKLDKVVALLQKHPDFDLKISGYTDSSGNDNYNLKLSDDRAHAVETYLKEKGIVASRITAKGYGEENPIADNATPAGRAKNRRVEFELIY